MADPPADLPDLSGSSGSPGSPPASNPSDSPRDGPSNFVNEIVAADVAAGKNDGRVLTRFPPEPNGYLHLGHAKAITLDFETAADYGGRCHLRFDDTNPEAEDTEFVEAIKRDVRWLGFDWGENLFFASDYFRQLHGWAVQLVEKGLAYVDSQTAGEIKENRGDYYTPGVDSPHRNRSVEENLALFEQMRTGELDEGVAVLRAKIDMQHGNLNMRDPLMYRIRKVSHHRTGSEWCIYPMYDWAHGQSDAIEGITHSLCTLEFEAHRPLYDWFLQALEIQPPPRQIEFAPLVVGYAVLSKRKLRQLVEESHVSGWDDPRMPTLGGLRRRGYPPEAIVSFCRRVGVAKRAGVIDVTLLEHAVRDHLNEHSPRVMAVVDPIRLVIENYPEDESEGFEARNHPTDAGFGTRNVPFSRVLYVERDDFREDPPRKWHRLAPGKEVRLRYACLVTCNEVIKDSDGHVVELRCTWDPESRGGTSPDGRKVRGTIHWVSAGHAIDAEVRLYDRLFTVEDPTAGEGSFLDTLNPNSIEVRSGCKVESSLVGARPETRVQFERLGYFIVDSDSQDGSLVFNRTIALKDSWAKLEKRGKAG